MFAFVAADSNGACAMITTSAGELAQQHVNRKFRSTKNGAFKKLPVLLLPAMMFLNNGVGRQEPKARLVVFGSCEED